MNKREELLAIRSDLEKVAVACIPTKITGKEAAFRKLNETVAPEALMASTVWSHDLDSIKLISEKFEISSIDCIDTNGIVR